MIAAAACAALVTGGILAPAPAAAIPCLVAICLGWPLLAAWELPAAIAAIKTEARAHELRRSLDALPEVEHPLGY